MINKKFIITALILTMCICVMLTSCGGRGSETESMTENAVSGGATDNKGPVGEVMDGVQEGVDDMGSDIKDSIEDATHAEADDTDDSARGDGHSDSDNKGTTEDSGVTAPSENARVRREMPRGK